MSYNFYSLVSSIKDKVRVRDVVISVKINTSGNVILAAVSTQAMATLSSDLKDFTAIIQEDVAEVATTVRKTVQEKSEAMRQRTESDAMKSEQEEHAEEEGEPVNSDDDDQTEGKPRAVSTASSTMSGDHPSEQQVSSGASTINSIFSSIGGYTLETSFGKLNFGEVGSKLLHTADELLGSLAGEHESTEDDEDNENALAARRFRLLALQEDSETYVEPPLDAETFAKWKAATPSVELEAVKAEVVEHYPAVVEKFSELVPSVVEADDFWAHYIYKASLLAAQEQRGADLLEHALNDSEEEIGWDVDSPRNDDTGRKTGSFFTEEETKEDHHDQSSEPAAAAASLQTPVKPDSSSSDGESWIELDERKDQQAPLSSSSVASSVQEPKSTTAVASALNETTTAAAAASGDDEEELDWGDDDLIPEEVLSGDEAITAQSAPEFHEEPKKRAGEWGEWD